MSGELKFTHGDTTDEETASVLRQRNNPRDDISVIDYASGILSQNGGRTFSMRSDYLDNMSVRTPKAPSTYSTT